MKKYVILGQSNYAVAIILDSLASLETSPFSVDIVANMPKEANESLAFPYAIEGVLTTEITHTDWQSMDYDGYFVGSIGKSRQAIVAFFEKECGIKTTHYTTLMHPSSVCASTVKVGAGVHIGPLSIIAPYAVLGDFTVINRQVSVGHHTILGNFVTFNPGTNVAGCCKIGDNVTIGTGATILDSLSIGANSIIGAGAVVTKDVPENVVVYGVPAKIIRQL
jgi:sugar O-acyltransferase (sialic acid O-acetyltransferase NeuD family)